MSTLHKVKAYFGMAPMEDYDDEYYDDRTPSRGYSRPRFEDEYGRYEGRDREYEEPDATLVSTRAAKCAASRPTTRRPPAIGGVTRDESRFPPREFDHPDMARPRLGSWLRGSTRGALAMDPRRMAMMFEEGHPLSKITTLRPKDYSEARTIGERFRDGTPVIMDLVSMDNADAKTAGRLRRRLGLRAARLVRQGRDQGVPVVARRRGRVPGGASPDRRNRFLRLPIGVITAAQPGRSHSWPTGLSACRRRPFEVCRAARSVGWPLPPCGRRPTFSSSSSLRSGSRCCCSFRSLGLCCSSSGCCSSPGSSLSASARSAVTGVPRASRW